MIVCTSSEGTAVQTEINKATDCRGGVVWAQSRRPSCKHAVLSSGIEHRTNEARDDHPMATLIATVQERTSLHCQRLT